MCIPEEGATSRFPFWHPPWQDPNKNNIYIPSTDYSPLMKMMRFSGLACLAAGLVLLFCLCAACTSGPPGQAPATGNTTATTGGFSAVAGTSSNQHVTFTLEKQNPPRSSRTSRFFISVESTQITWERRNGGSLGSERGMYHRCGSMMQRAFPRSHCRMDYPLQKIFLQVSSLPPIS